MMGRTHATSGAVIWLAGSALLTAAGAEPGLGAVIVGAAVTAGAALLPDLDHQSSTVAHTAGPVSQLACRLVARGCARAHAATRTYLDRPDRDGHRTLTHTAIIGLAAGLLAGLVCWLAGGWGTAVVVYAVVALGVRGGVRRRVRGEWGAIGIGVLAAAIAGPTIGAAWWLGLAVAVGWLAHLAGDALTNSGCPILWPLKICGRRWYPVGSPRVIRMRTGGTAERAVYVVLLLVGAVSTVSLAIT